MVCIIAWTHLSERIIPALGKITPRETWLLSSIVRIKAASDANGNLAGAAEENRRL